ncbi:flagellar biosynthesis anti-sigma factor FlgM [Streptomyces sp. MUSC 125]|uniref:M4 family metallopeptidase n=1 Tax=Streptomyces sp. MUSC 125 TaxID=1428624 RepID=UPI00057D6338|nr:M4 family metallopeptidase [Streptomyces sp. MUSC 125]KIE23087.1 flagellar biosynthesis anti-sigma factor FlgM [Streptomyces sp. MUSC 125]
MGRPHIRRVAVAVAVATAATGLAGTAFAGPSTGVERSAASARTSASASAAAVVAAARAAAFAHASASGVSKGDELHAQDVMIDPEGARHVRFVRTHHNLPVLGGDLVVHLNNKLAYTGVTRAAGHAVKPDTTRARLTARQAASKAARAAEGHAGGARLVVDARGGGAALAYQVTVTSRGASHTVVVDAVTGKVRSDIPDSDEFLSPKLVRTLRKRGETINPATGSGSGTARASLVFDPGGHRAARYPANAKGTGKSLFVGKVRLTTTQTSRGHFQLRDRTRYGTETRDAKGSYTESFTKGKKFTSRTDVWGNGKTSSRTSAAADAQYGVTETLDFYKKTFKRKGIANDGKAAHAMVHWGKKVANAFWDPTCNCMLYGDGDGKMFKKPLVVLDVTGHELTHGVVDATAKLEPTYVDSDGNQYGEPGALNESLADIFGSNVEFFAHNKKDTPDFLIGEKLGLKQKFLRRLDHPSLDKLEGTIDYWSPETYYTEVHAGSGVSSHAYYLLAEGSGKRKIGGVTYDSPTYDNSKVKGIGRTKATAIFYRALTRYMVSTTDFHGARVATLKAAKDLYGAKSTEYKTVDRAWAAVNVTAANRPTARR